MMKDWDKRLNLVRELVMKDLKTRYSRPALGFFWAFLSPLFMVLVFYIVFGLILRVKTEGVPFVLYLMSGVFPWLFFQDSIMKSVTSLMDNRNLIKESNFPHWLIPVSIVLANGISFLPSLGILIVAVVFISRGVPAFFLLLPVILTIYLMVAVGISVISSILYVKWRDTKYILETILLALFYSTPVFYPLNIVRGSFNSFWFNVYAYNPFVGMLNLYRSVILKGFYQSLKAEVAISSFTVIPACFGILVLWLGFYFYKKSRNNINDHLSY
ncbi:MAG: ABC transporter permease [Candidatus Omnitrophica bacterium]|nr:ABC transporter permease [Candidatus Omnitrophota bacterium]